MRQQAQRGPGALEAIRLEDVVQEDVVTADPDKPVRSVVGDMADQDVGSVVVTEDGQPGGLVTDRRIALELEQSPDIAQQEVRELVDGEPTTADPSMTIFDALRLMSDEDIRRLPVVDDSGALQGIITLDDALVLLAAELGNAAEVIRSQSPRL